MRPLSSHFRLCESGSRKLIITPDGTNRAPAARFDSALAKELARALRWQRMLDSRECCCSITELAAAEKIDRSYLCRVLRLTLLAPEMVEAKRMDDLLPWACRSSST